MEITRSLTPAKSRIDFLTIGHIAKDLVPGGHTVGGTVTFASVTALRMGLRPGVITRLGPDLKLPALYEQIELLPLPSAATTTFENIYTPGGRVQILHAVADPIGSEHIPLSWRHNLPIVLLGPLANEVAPEVAGLFHQALVGVVPQGWLRRWDTKSRVSPKPWECAHTVLPQAAVLVLSIEDVQGDLALAESYSRLVPIMVLTRSAEGCDLYYKGEVIRVPPRPAQEVDPTGAGDVFAAAFLIRLRETADPLEAARFANVTASFSVEGPGYSAVPTRAQVEAWLAEHA